MGPLARPALRTLGRRSSLGAGRLPHTRRDLPPKVGPDSAKRNEAWRESRTSELAEQPTATNADIPANSGETRMHPPHDCCVVHSAGANAISSASGSVYVADSRVGRESLRLAGAGS